MYVVTRVKEAGVGPQEGTHLRKEVWIWAQDQYRGWHPGRLPKGRSTADPEDGNTDGHTDFVLTDEELDAIEARSKAASPGPWRSFVEGRDHLGGDDFIRVSDDSDEPDMYVIRAEAGATRPASVADQDFIAAARQDIPTLVAELRRLRSAPS